ncbi:hypothetical protein [Rhodococcus sp. USK13]|uniref:hypothetical protein n=1 Tax=Rhodococcus sp. USK13 TaxID=2806442 RepID=UPI001BCAB889|nr:hypothetical protein [Rhodococcus sp. USK13]
MDGNGKENGDESAPVTGSGLERGRPASVVSSTEVEKLIPGISEYDYATSYKLSDLKRLDRSSLTPELTRKLDERKKAGVNDHWAWAPKSGWGTTAALAVLSLVSLLCAIAIVAAQGEPSPLTTTIPFLLPTGLGIAAAARGRRAAHHPLHLTTDERIAIEEAYKGTGFPAEARKQPRDAEKNRLRRRPNHHRHPQKRSVEVATARRTPNPAGPRAGTVRDREQRGTLGQATALGRHRPGGS